MVDISTLSTVIAATSVVIGVVFAVLQLRNLVKTRKTDLVMRLYSTMGSEEWQKAWYIVWNLEFKDYNDFVKKYGQVTSETSSVNIPFYRIGLFYEGIGVLLNRKLVDIELVDDLFHSPILYTWEKMKPIVEGSRKQFNVKSLEWFEYLYNEIKKREQKLQQAPLR